MATRRTDPMKQSASGMIRERVDYCRDFGRRIGNDGLVKHADTVVAMLDRKASMTEIIRSEAYKVVVRVWNR